MASAYQTFQKSPGSKARRANNNGHNDDNNDDEASRLVAHGSETDIERNQRRQHQHGHDTEHDDGDDGHSSTHNPKGGWKNLYYLLFVVFLMFILFQLFVFISSRNESLLNSDANESKNALSNSHSQPLAQPVVVRNVPGIPIRMNISATLVHYKILYNNGTEMKVDMISRTFNSSVPGPTIRVQPGTSVEFVVRNTLEANDENAPSIINTFRLPNTTVLHFHGLHVSPEAGSDDVYTGEIKPGEEKRIKLDIPLTHPRGTFFIHPHFQGSSTIQISNAMASALIVEDLPNEMSTAWKQIKDISLLVQNLNLGTNKTKDYLKQASMSHSTMHILTPNRLPVNELIVNGVSRPIIDAVEKEWIRLRIIHGAQDGLLIMRMLNDKFEEDDACKAWIIARDGVYLRFPKFLFPSLILSPGSRADILFQGSGVNNRCQIVSQPYSNWFTSQSNFNFYRWWKYFMGNSNSMISQTDPVLEGTVLTIRVTKSLKTPEELESLNALPKLPTFKARVTSNTGKVTPLQGLYLDDLSDITKEDEEINHFTLVWTVGREKVRRGGDLYNDYGVNNVSFVGEIGKKIKLGALQEWLIINPDSENHPFHLHTNHFQIVNSSVGNNDDYNLYEWRDVITVPALTNVTIRFRPLDFVGKSMAHCHIYSHEDIGMDLGVEIIH